MCFNVDYRILHMSITEQATQDATHFYTLFYNAPPAIKALLHSMMGFGILSLLGKLHKWDESAMWFDGSSLAAFVFAISIYLTVIIPNLQNVVNPGETTSEFTHEQSLSLIGAGNSIVMVILILIMALQAGQEYARRVDAKNMAALAAKDKDLKSQ